MADPTPRKPERMPLHWLYFLLYEIGLLSGLWLHGDPRLTIGLLIITLPLGLVAYIPYRFLHEDLRQILHYLMAASAIAWSIYRFSHGPPLDILLVETFAMMGLSFAFTSHRRGYYFMLMIGIILLLYGSVVPPREIYVLIMPLAFLMVMMLLYQTRTAALANDADLSTRGAISRYNSPWFVVHIVSVVFVWVLLIVLFPTPSWQTPGYMATSTRHHNTNVLPPRLDAWFSSERQRGSRDAGRYGTVQRPTDIAPEGSMQVQSDVWVPDMSEGSGGGPPGKDLVMRVKSPVKLYWLGRLYDAYDGAGWQATPEMNRQRPRLPDLSDNVFKAVRQQVIIEKWISHHLFAAYLRSGPLLPGPADVAIKYNFATARVAKTDAPLPIPFSYEARSLIDFHLSSQVAGIGRVPGWYEEVPPEHYLQLPEEAISQRLRRLANTIVTGQTTDLKKAMTLRNWFREHFEYVLQTPPLPEGREPVDYFVFELRKGHCEYYASALAVMARIVGLPARVATGFSPGNYNVLTGMFEVYEYHAHAWTQVYIGGTGWITLDGTPPGSLPTQSRTSPFMIGDLRDPFSDDWRINPPEFSEHTQSYMREQLASEQARKREQQQAAESGNAPRLPNLQDANQSPQVIAEALRAEMARARAESDRAESSVFGAFTSNFKRLLQRVWEAIKGGIRLLVTLIFTIWTILGLLALLLFRRFYPAWRAKRFRRQQIQRCESYYQNACELADRQPDASILAGYNSVRLILDLAGFPKENVKELEDYAREDIGPSLRAPSTAIFTAYVKATYRPERPSAAEARIVIEHTEAIHRILMPGLKDESDG